MIEPQQKLAKVGGDPHKRIPDFLIMKIGDNEIKKVVGVIEVKQYVSGGAEEQVQNYCQQVHDLGEAHGVFQAFQVGEEIHGYDSMDEEIKLEKRAKDQGLAEYLFEILKNLKTDVETAPVPSTIMASIPDAGSREISLLGQPSPLTSVILCPDLYELCYENRKLTLQR